jgi:hypothetical protein
MEKSREYGNTLKHKHTHKHTHIYIRIYKDKGKGKGKVKVKAVPLQAWSGPEGSRTLRFPDYMTTA